MHLFLRAIGFSDCSDNQMDTFIDAALKKQVNDPRLVKICDEFGRMQILIPVSESTGIYAYGKKIDNNFKLQYYYPMMMGSSSCSNEELTIERHLDKESYEVVCDNIKAGVTLMFYLQNPLDYLMFRAKKGEIEDTEGIKFSLHRKNLAEKTAIPGKKVVLSALSTGGMVLLPSYDPVYGKINKSRRQLAKEARRESLINAARNGDQEAIESLTIDDLDIYTNISKRIVTEDVLSIVESSFMPCGVECDQYAVIGEILEIEVQENVLTEEKIFLMKLECNDIIFDMAISETDLIGEPMPGRRFKGNVWLQGEVKFDDSEEI